MTENKRFIIYMGEPYYNNVFFKYDESADDYQFLCRTSDFGSILEELNALADEIEQKNETNQKLYDKLQVTMSRNSLNRAEVELLKKENKQLRRYIKNNYMGSVCDNCEYCKEIHTNDWFNGIVHDAECEKGHINMDISDCEDFKLTSKMFRND